MITALQHRGPDEAGIYRDDCIGMVSTRLSILDIGGGQQPISNEDGTLWIVFNGEIFNYIELRPGLEAQGHRFSTRTDTEVVLHLFEEYGPDCLGHLNGQFAVAIWDAENRSLFLARDRLGIRPLFYARHESNFLFGSEVKALLAQPGFRLQIAEERLKELFTYWSPIQPHSIFRGVKQVPPGHFMLLQEEGMTLSEYWSVDFSSITENRSVEDYLDELRALLIDATKLRLRADVPVGAYLSGGMDSSLIAALVRRHTGNHLDTFSIAFSDPQYDEAAHQKRMASELGTTHQEVYCDYDDISDVFPDVIWHTETPILRTSPAPMYLLSRRVHEHGYKVVLTGEGADEFWAGYDIFKEMRIRRFWARQPASRMRPELFRKLYQDIPGLSTNTSFLRAFFGKDLEKTESPYYSHLIRWGNTARCLRFLSDEILRDYTEQKNGRYPIALPDSYAQWAPLAQAQYLEIETFLSPYLLSSQGDRMAMAHSVEGRYPFLDHRVVELANRLPSSVKQLGLQEKWLLKKMAQEYLPDEIWKRTKRPYRAPIQRAFFCGSTKSEYVRDMLSRETISRSGYFNPDSVEMLVNKASSHSRLSEVDEMALVGILSTQLVDELFVRNYAPESGFETLTEIKLIDRRTTEVSEPFEGK
jgi:asparagine synthase (glutamine-hydrolysing)